VSWKTRTRGSRRGQRFHPRTVFGEAQDQAIAQEVHATSVADAERSVKTLRSDFDSAKERSKKEHIWHSTLNEANRLEIGVHNMNYHPDVRANMAEREKVFRGAASHMHSELWTPDGSPRS